jgi:hypothetical protein
MDLSKFSTEDLEALKAGDLTRVSDAGLNALKQQHEPPKKAIFGQEGFAQAMREELALQNPGPITRMALGVSGAVDDAAMRLKQLTGRSDIGGLLKNVLGVSFDLSPQEQQAVTANRVNREDPFGMAGGVAGNIAMTGAPAGAAYRGIAGLVPQTANVVARTAAPTAAAAVTGGMVADATTPVLPGESENKNVALGAAGGAAGDAAGRILGRVFQGVRPTPEAQALMREGVQPTIGQAAGANSMLGRIEQGLQSLPFVGDIIRSARGRATEEFNVAAIRRALPTNQKGEITQAGRESITQAQRLLSRGYDDVLTRINNIQPDRQFMGDLTRIASDPDLALPPALQTRYAEILRAQFGGRVQNGQIDADLAKRIDSNLGALYRRYRTSSDGDQRALGSALSQAQVALRGLFQRNAAPDDAQTLQALNGHYANLLRVERAAGRVGADDGVFSAAQLSSSVRAMDPSKGKRAYAQGNALMQDLSDPGRAVLNQTVPDSGTTGRALLAATALGGAGVANEQMNLGPSWLTAALLSPLLYSRTGSAALTGQLTPTMVQALGGAGPTLTGIGSYLAKEEMRDK